jgi:hypothetical protein
MNKAAKIANTLCRHLELICWVMAIVVLFFSPMKNGEVSFCAFKWLGFSACPGCGLGHAIHAALHFQFVTSFQYHPLGIPAVIIIFNRIKQLLRNLKHHHEAKSYQPSTGH